jgi:thioredoxin-like negative regulator of GroEL
MTRLTLPNPSATFCRIGKREDTYDAQTPRLFTRPEGYVLSTTAQHARRKPGLVYFHSRQSGRCRRVEGYIAQVLQRRRNHDTFKYYSVAREARPDLVAKFGITQVPALVVLEDQQIRGKLESPRGCKDIERFLSSWLA